MRGIADDSFVVTLHFGVLTTQVGFVKLGRRVKFVWRTRNTHCCDDLTQSFVYLIKLVMVQAALIGNAFALVQLL